MAPWLRGSTFTWCRPGFRTLTPTPNRTCKFPSIRLSRCFLASNRIVLLPMTVQAQGLNVIIAASQCECRKALDRFDVIELRILVGYRSPTLPAPVLKHRLSSALSGELFRQPGHTPGQLTP